MMNRHVNVCAEYQLFSTFNIVSTMEKNIEFTTLSSAGIWSFFKAIRVKYLLLMSPK